MLLGRFKTLTLSLSINENSLAPVLGTAAFLLAFVSSCTPGHHRRSADQETFRILKAKGDAVINMETDFHIDPPPALDLLEFARSEQSAEFLGNSADREKAATVLTLDDALAISVTRSRSYLSRKEDLYLQGLGLTLARHAFTPIFSGTGSAGIRSVPIVGATETTPASASNPATATVENGIDRIVRDNSFTRTGSFGVSSLQRTGARLAADFSTDFLRFLTGNARTANSSSLVATLTQPLLRGAGREATMENLTSAERGLLYGVRDFTRFRKSFAVDVATSYYQIIQSRDAARNAWLANQAFQGEVQRAEALHQADRLTPSELGLLQQAALRSELEWVNAVAFYELGLDQFKIELGLPVEERIVLDPDELTRLKIIHPEIEQQDAIQIALTSRLDYHTALQEVEDAQRRIRVAANALKPGLDLSGSVDVPGPATDGRPKLKFDTPTWAAGIDLDLPFDVKDERNNYRASLIDEERSRRDLALAEDTIKLQVIDGFRDIERARRQYEISVLGVELSEKRLAAERAFLEAGRSTARDLVDAQLDYVESLNQLTAAKVGHTIARLSFWRDLGILFIKPNGQWIKKLQNAESN